MNVFDLSAKITMDINGYLKGMSTAKGIAVSTLSVIGGAAQEFMQDSVNTGKVFDSSMSQVAATMGATTEELSDSTSDQAKNFQKLRNFAQEMGRTTAFTASQSADALNYMALAGYDTEQSMEALPNVLNLAASGSMDLARASDMITDTQTAFGISMKRSKKMVDEMAKAASTGNTSVEQMGDAFLVVGGLAQELNGGLVELEDGTTASTDGIQELEIALTAMANAGVKGSEAGTHMRNMLLKLSSPTKDGAAQMEKLGVQVFDAEGKMRSLKDIFGDLNTSMSTLTQEQKIQAISDLFNTRDMASAEALLNAVGQDWDQIGSAILDAEGAAEEMAEVQLDNLEGDTKLLQSAVEGAEIAISDALNPALRWATQFETDFVTSFTEGFQSLPPEVQTVVAVIGDIGTKIASVLPQVIGMADSLSNVAVNMKKLNIGWGSGLLSAGGIGMVAGVGAAVAVVAAAVWDVVNAFEKSIELEKELKDTAETRQDEYHQERLSLAELKEAIKNETDEQKKRDIIEKQLEINQRYRTEATEAVASAQHVLADETVHAREAEESWFGALAWEQQKGTLATAMSLTGQLSDEKLQLYTSSYKVANQMGIEDVRTREASNAIEKESETVDEAAQMSYYLENQLKHLAWQEAAAKNAANDLGLAHINLGSGVKTSSEAYQEAATNTLQRVTGAMQGMTESLGRAGESAMMNFNEVAEAQELSGEKMRENWAAQIENTKNWETNLSELLRLGIDEGIVQQFADAGPDSAAEVKAMIDDINSAGSEGIPEMTKKWNDLYSESLQLEKGTNAEADKVIKAIGEIEVGGEKEFKRLAEVFNLKSTDVGGNFSKGFIEGASELLGQIEETGEDVGDSMKEGTEISLDSHSPSREAEKLGMNYDEGLKNGIVRSSTSVATAAQKLGNAVVTYTRRGINEKVSELWTTITNIAATLKLKAEYLAGQWNAGLAAISGENGLTGKISAELTGAVSIVNQQSYKDSFKTAGESLAKNFADGFVDSVAVAYIKQRVNEIVAEAYRQTTAAVEDKKPTNSKGINSMPYTVGAVSDAEPHGITLNVYGSENQNVNELADLVMDRLDRAVRRKELAYG